MKIENDNKAGLLDSLSRAAQSKPQNQPAVDKKASEGTSDKVEISSKKQQVDELKEKAAAQPAVRQDKVDALKEAIANQTYNVKGELVARSMMKSQLLDQLL